jgi:arylsulfatase A-like enzyme
MKKKRFNMRIPEQNFSPKPAVLAVCTALLLGASGASGASSKADGSELPFAPAPTASKAGPTLQTSTHHRRQAADHLPKNAPNVLIVMIDDVGFGQASTFGGDIHTPTLDRIAKSGISYNAMHNTSISSPTRAALLTGRNHQRVGNGTIAERAVDWDGYSGVMPKTSATMAEVLKQYGYKTSAFGKWHNTPADQTTAMGPFDNWPTGYGFEYFYGWLAGETSQFEPRLVENTNFVEPPVDPKYHVSEDLANHAVGWLKKHESYAPDKPFFMYFATGGGHGPHHVGPEWIAKYKGKFDQGYEAMREGILKRQKEMGWVPQAAELTKRVESMPAWDSIPAAQRPFQLRLMETYAGFVEHTDTQVGKVIDELERQGKRDNTIIIYLFGDNGASAEGQQGSISELLAQNNIPNTVEQQMAALDKIGGLDALGTHKVDNMYHAGWAWAGNTPFKSTKLVAAHFGGTRSPMAISWPAKIKPDTLPRAQFHHVNDIAPTVFELIGIKPPKVVNGYQQDPIDGISLAYTFDNPKAPTRKKVQYFENNGSRGIYMDGWYAAAFGPLVPWNTAGTAKDALTWDASKDQWELYNLNEDYSQAHDLAAQNPKKLDELKREFDQQAKANKVWPVGGGLWLRIHPEDRLATPYRSWTFSDQTRRMPEFTAPGLGRESNQVIIDAEIGENASGVLYALGGAGGGIVCYMDKGKIVYLYNMMIIEQYQAESGVIAAGKHQFVIDTQLDSKKPMAGGVVTVTVDGKEVAKTRLVRTVPAAFTASESFDVGVDLGSTVALAYDERRPFAFNGKINSVKVNLK